jgi:hypothetical protein
MEVVPGWRHDWIEIAPQPPTGQGTLIRLGRKNKNRQIWDALARAGVHPVGSPPQ